MGKEGRPRLTQHVRRTARNAVSPHPLNKLFLIIPPGMMRRLILDVGDDAICLRCAHAEGAITFLPGETRSRRSRVIEPFSTNNPLSTAPPSRAASLEAQRGERERDRMRRR